MTDARDGSAEAKSVPPCKARDLFAAATDVFPVLFYGSRVHLLIKSRDPWALAHVPPPPPPFSAAAAADDVPPPSRWSAASALKGFANGGGTAVRLAGTLGFRSQLGSLACGTVEVNPISGNWSFETVAKSSGGAVDVSAAGQMCWWTRPLTCSYDVDYTAAAAGTALSVTANPVRKTCAFQYLQAVSRRLSLGAELGFSAAAQHARAGIHSGPGFRPALLARYAGPAYLLSAKVNTLTGSAKLAWYRHNNDRLQTAVVLETDRPRSVAVAELAFRVLTGRSSARGSFNTDGVLSCQVERRLGDGLSASLSVRVENRTGRYGLGAGLSFG